ncbi:hypothetical protein KAT08_01800 [Candidatus Babeliales bacterium]|nr:hypothetical protein [Candidatus Babeliales bacterium]
MQNKKFLIFLFSFSLCIHFLFVYFFFKKESDHFVPRDSAQYHDVAFQIANGMGISNMDGSPSFYRVPGYSLFLAFCYKIFDFDLKKTIWLQVFLSSLIPIFVFLLSLAFFPNQLLLAKIASIFMVFNLGMLVHCALLMSEVFFMIFSIIFSILFFSSFNLFICKSKDYFFSYKKIFFSGIFLGVSSLIRPVGHFILIITIFLLIFSDFIFLKKLKSLGVLFLGWVLIVFWWLFRNYLLTGMIFFHGMTGYHFLNYFASEIDCMAKKTIYSKSKDKLLEEWQNLILEKEKEKGNKIGQIERCSLAGDLALKIIKENIFLSIKHSGLNIFKTIFGLHSVFFISRFSLSFPNYTSKTTMFDKIKNFIFPKISNKFIIFLIYLEIILLVFILLGFFCYGIVSIFCFEKLCSFLKVLPLITLLLFLTFGSGIARLRIPVEPFLIIFSFNFWINFFSKYKKIL